MLALETPEATPVPRTSENTYTNESYFSISRSNRIEEFECIVNHVACELMPDS